MVSSWAVAEDIAAGRLVELFPQWRPSSLPVHLVYPWARYYPTRLRKVSRPDAGDHAGLPGCSVRKAHKKTGQRPVFYDARLLDGLWAGRFSGGFMRRAMTAGGAFAFKSERRAHPVL
jgi:hypothetical protein